MTHKVMLRIISFHADHADESQNHNETPLTLERTATI